MYSTKNIENILLAELLPNQYRDWMQDSQKSSKTSFRDMLKLRKSNVFQQIFGNKQRIWLKLDIENTNKEEERKRILRSVDIPSIITDSFKSLLYGYYLIKGINTSDIQKLVRSYIYNITETKLIDMYVNGYIINPDNQKEEKLGKFYQKVLQLLNKHRTNIAKHYGGEEIDDLISTIQGQYKSFNLRKEKRKDGTRVLNEDIVSLWDNTPLDWYACISRDPQDVGAMSTGQGWSSCQDLDKDNTGGIEYNEYNWHTLYDVSKGTCVAYLINSQAIKQSRNRFQYKTEHFPLLSPTARVAIKPFHNENGEIYLSIGLYPRTYGNNSYTREFVDIVQKYLENKQSNISGNFRIPRELYNEGIGNANTVIVKNGKIVDTAGEDDSFEVDPALEEQKSTYFMIYNEILDYYVENEEYPVMLFDTTIQNKTFDNILNTISFCKFDNCDFANISVNILDDFSKQYRRTLKDIIRNELLYSSQNSFEMRYNTTLNKNTLLKFLSIYLDEYMLFKQQSLTKPFSSFINCNFDYCEQIKPDMYALVSFIECTFDNSNVVLPRILNEANAVDKCNFSGCSIITPSINKGNITNCNFNACDIECDSDVLLRPWVTVVFENCRFNSCSMFNTDNDFDDETRYPIQFKDCIFNDNKLSGYYELNNFDNGIPIREKNLKKII